MPVPSKVTLCGSFWDLNLKNTEEDMSFDQIVEDWKRQDLRHGRGLMMCRFDRPAKKVDEDVLLDYVGSVSCDGKCEKQVTIDNKVLL